MSCKQGQVIHDEFDNAVAVRAAWEADHADTDRIKAAKMRESEALRARAFHIRDCPECWQQPPGQKPQSLGK